MAINELLVKLIHTAKEIEGIDFFMGKAELTKTEYRLLREIILERRKGGEIISSELAKRLGVTRSAISQIVLKLEAKEVIQRVPCPTDRKIAYLRLTDSAEAAFKKHRACANKFMKEVVALFGEERMEHFVKEYDELSRVMTQVKKQYNENSV